MNGNDLTLAGAIAASESGVLHEWLQGFLRSEDGLNESLANYLEEHRPLYDAPALVALELLSRISGPEDGLPHRHDPREWEEDVAAKAASIDAGWEPPPLIAPRSSLALSDGNRRYEALRRCGRTEYWTILFEAAH